MDQVYGYKKLIVWKKANDLAFQVYLKTREFPREEQYGVVSQLRRAAISVPTNIVEGMGRQGRKELKQFVNIGLGSLAEVEYLMSFSRRLGYLSVADYDSLDKLRYKVGCLLWKFYRSL